MTGVLSASHRPPDAQHYRGLDYPFGRWSPPADRPFEVAPGIRWLRMPLPFSLDHINLWLLDDCDEAGTGTAIVDTGLDAPACREVWQALLPGLRVTRVIITHFHPDHVGLAGWLTQRAAGLLHMSRTDYLMARLLQLDVRDGPPEEAVHHVIDAGWPDEAIAAYRQRSWGQFAAATSPVPGRYRRLQDGEEMLVGDRRWRILMGRGHAPEHACLVDEAGGVMIAGDQLLPRISSNVSVPVMEPESDPLQEWLESLAALRCLPADMLVLPSHGHPFHGLRVRVDQLLEEHRVQLERLVDFCARPRTVYETLGLLFGGRVNEATLGLATGEALAHLRRLERQGLVRRERHGAVSRYRSV